MRVLVLHKGGIGDIVFGLPLFHDLKNGLPNAHVTVLTHAVGCQVLEYSPDVDELLVLSDRCERWSLAEARAALGPRRFEVAVSTSRSLRVAWLLFRSGTRCRVGFGDGLESLLYTHVAPVRPSEVEFAKRFQRLSGTLGLQGTDAPAVLRISPRAAERAHRQLIAAGWSGRAPLTAVHVGGGWRTKRWPVEHIVAFATRVAALGGQVVLQGGRADGETAAIVSRAVGGAALDTTHESVSDAIAKASQYTACVGIDSGLSHAVAACGVPTAFLFGPNEPRSIRLARSQRILTRAGLACRPCNRSGRVACPEGHHRCMVEHHPDEVLRALASIVPALRGPDALWPLGLSRSGRLG